METSTSQRPEVSKSKPVEDLNEIREDAVENKDLDSPIVLEESVTNIQNESTTSLQNWREFFTPKGQQRVEDSVRANLQAEADKLVDNSSSFDTSKSSPEVITKTNRHFCKEIQFTDVALKSVCSNIETIAERAHLNVNKSDELTKYWSSLKVRLQEIINNINANKRNRVVTFSVCLIGFGLMLWKMGAMRSIPNFMTNMISLMPMPRVSPTGVDKDIPLPSTKSLQAILESPLTPLTIVTGVGVITISLGVLKLIAWTLRRIPK